MLFNKKLTRKTRIFLYSIISLLCVSIPTTLIVISSTKNKSSFVFGNFSSYMSPEVKEILSQKYNVSFDNYENSDSIAYNFKKNNMDLAVSTSYETVSLIKNKILKKIDWSQLGFTSSNDALKVFTPSVQSILTEYDFDDDGNNDNLLDYAIPYFIQDLVFIYCGNKSDILDDASWNDVFKFIETDSRFNPKKMNSILPLVGLIDDSRTIYSLSRMITNQDINPFKNESINELLESYKTIVPYVSDFGDKSILFSDSNTLLNKISNNELNGAIIYNGDGIFSALGGDDSIAVDENKFHIIKPKDTLVALDLVVINNKITNENINKAYNIVNDLCLKFDENDFENEISYINFDYVNYTPSLMSLYEFVKKNYFDGALKPKLLQLFEISENINNVEKPVDNLVKSNLLFAYICFKQNI